MSTLKRLLINSSLILAAIAPIVLYAYEYGPDPGYTAAPGDNATGCTASGCHTDAPNTGPGAVQITASGGTIYVPGQTQQIQVTITDNTEHKYGFELTARVDGNPAVTGAGTLASTDTNTVVFTCGTSGYTPYVGSCPSGNTLQWISHNITGYAQSANKAPSFTYTFNWTPPAANIGTVTLYAAAIAGSGALVVNLTHTYLAKLQLSPSSIQLGDCVGMFSTTTNLVCSAMNQSSFEGNPAVSIGTETTYYGAMTLVGGIPFGDAAGMALYNAGGGGGASVSLDLYNTSYNAGIPQAKIKAIDDGNYSDHLSFWTKVPGGQNNAVTERVRITSTGIVAIGTTNPTLGPLQMGSGAYVSEGGIWTNASDRNAKENFVPVNPAAMLEKIDELPLLEWNYKAEDPSVRHIGPTAQDFYSIFAVGNSSTSISTVDPSGVALAGIQGLDQKSQGRSLRLIDLKNELEAEAAELRSLREQLDRLEYLLKETMLGANTR